MILTGLKLAETRPVQHALADSLYREIPAGIGSKGAITLDDADINAMLTAGARWAVERGWGEERDLQRIEEGGIETGAKPGYVSERAKERQRREMGTLGSGNHYLEVQAVADILDLAAAEAFHLSKDDVVITIHCGSRGLGHQIGSEYLKEMAIAGRKRPGSTYPTANSRAHRSNRMLANVISAPCVRRSIARWPIGKSSVITRGRSSDASSRTPRSI